TGAGSLRQSSGLRLGSHRSPRSRRTVVTVSTSNWVSARSGAESQTKLTQLTRPAPDIRINAARRWNLACHAAPIAQNAPTIHKAAKPGLIGVMPAEPKL